MEEFKTPGAEKKGISWVRKLLSFAVLKNPALGISWRSHESFSQGILKKDRFGD